MKEPASIRFKNPGAMWGSALAIKWGAQKKPVTLKDGKGQGNNIAVFPTYVQGICAQLDLWRSSKSYKNKKFCDAIAIWSGHNNVESYIKFVLKRVPSMTRNTVMNDAFWQSSKGIAFLKAQAWHEAGKKYPAPDADWIAAQNIVFGNAVPSQPVEPKPDLNVQPVTTQPSVDVETVQRKLEDLGYHEVGTVDGLWGGKTAAAIAAFKNDRGLTGDPLIDKPLKDAIDKAVAENWKRPVSEARANATAQDIAPKVASVQPTLWQRFVAKIAGFGAVGSAAIAGTSDKFSLVSDQIGPVKQFFDHVPGWAWFLLVAAGAFGVWFMANKATNATVDDYNKGKIN